MFWTQRRRTQQVSELSAERDIPKKVKKMPWPVADEKCHVFIKKHEVTKPLFRRQHSITPTNRSRQAVAGTELHIDIRYRIRWERGASGHCRCRSNRRGVLRQMPQRQLVSAVQLQERHLHVESHPWNPESYYCDNWAAR